MISEERAPGEAFVWAWLPGATEPVVAGRIERDGEFYVFNYGRSYLEAEGAIPLYVPELSMRVGRIDPIAPLQMAGALRDAAPDAWGRRVIINRLTGSSGKDADVVELDELTFMLESGSDRIGGLDFQRSSSDYTARETGVASLDELREAAAMVDDGVPLTPALAEVLQHGTAIGGARPKALIDDRDKKYIAKFSSSNDTYSVVKGEYVAMRMAALAGLNVGSVKLMTSVGTDVLLIERFDRQMTGGGWSRRMLVSALTILGLDEIMAAHASYQELAESIRARFSEPRKTLHELFARMTFNILVGNTDDHARNHAAFWNGDRLTLSPAYDICPQARAGREASQAMRIVGTERRSLLSLCLAAAPEFHLSGEAALRIMTDQITLIRNRWDALCGEAGLSEVDRRLLWRRQFLNDLAFEGMEDRLAEAIAGLD
ncbi:MAG: HipA domain-containing protein [Rhodobacter sp.]|nr:HipA domain-containing protein [Rhodobacter sp.]